MLLLLCPAVMSLTQGDSVLQLHELMFFHLFFLSALAQLLFMFARPRQYKQHRQWIAALNRILRLLLTLLGAVFVSPEQTRRRSEAFAAASSSSSAALAAASPARIEQQSSIRSTTAADEPATLAAVGSVTLAFLARAALLEPAFGLLHANFLVPFRAAVVIQFVSFLASAYRHVAPLCASTPYVDPSATVMLLPLCQRANWLMYAGAQLLDWHFPADPAWLSTASDQLCQQPLAVLVLIHTWVRLLALLLVPCAVLYYFERSLKSTFLQRHAANAALGSPSSPQQPTSERSLAAARQVQSVRLSQLQPSDLGERQTSGSSRARSAAQQQQRHQTGWQRGRSLQLLEQTLQAVQPASLADLLQPAGLIGGLLRLVYSVGAVLCVLMVSWWVCELGVIAVLHGREFVCDADGWLHLQQSSEPLTAVS